MKRLFSRAGNWILNLSLLTATSLAWFVGPVSAQAAPQSTRNESVSIKAMRVQIGSVIPGILDRKDGIVDNRYVTAYRFSGQAGAAIQVRATGSNDTRTVNNLSLKPYLVLYGPKGQIVARTGVAPGSIDAFIRLRLPESGDYTAVIASVDRLKPGRYWFVVQALPESAARTLTRIEVSEPVRDQAAIR